MPAQIVSSFAKKTGKSEKEIEKLWDKAKEIVFSEYDYDENDKRFWALVVSVLKKMLKINESTYSFKSNFDNIFEKTFLSKDLTNLFVEDKQESISVKSNDEKYEWKIQKTKKEFRIIQTDLDSNEDDVIEVVSIDSSDEEQISFEIAQKHLESIQKQYNDFN